MALLAQLVWTFLYLFVFTPIGLVARRIGARRLELLPMPEKASYWMPRTDRKVVFTRSI